MNCQEWEKSLEIYLSGEIANQQNEEMTMHVQSCKPCQSLLAAEQKILTGLKGLKTDILPSTNLWHGIEKKIDATNESFIQQFLHFFAGHKIVLTASFSLFLIGLVLGALFFNPAFRFGSLQTNSLAGTMIIREFASAETAYKEAKSTLLKSLEKSGIAGETIDIIEKDLLLIDYAIIDMRTAVYQQPGNQQNLSQLADLYQEETRYIIRTNGLFTNIN